MEGFPGFSKGKLKMTPLPDAFFGELLPLIDDLAELKVTLHCFWLFHQKQGEVRYTTLGELRADKVLQHSLQNALPAYSAITPLDALQEGLERAVARGTLLQVSARRPAGAEGTCYLFNTERGRQAVARIESGEWVPPEMEGSAVQLAAHRPNIFNLYEQNIGLIQPLIAEELKDAEESYPAEWIEDAFRIAVENNARSWSYVRTILQRWEREGRGERRQDDDRDRRRYIGGQYADLIKH